ncbi:3-hydroxyisobutyrate dehydrogenase [Kushneria marisflavi]|uniref:3-hydroxyisobutyrate dehydrogenase n=2 Tax=Kushneria marisflavi TaxID=157779 RepID=A0A240UU89_9GAMM|nr:3-hydroxyisobutyrate dehydrogenase [Kushneria marisflavi]
MKIVVIGLGQMGGNMALTLKRAGFEVTGIDPNDQTRQLLSDQGLIVSSDTALPAADIYLLSLPTADHVRTVIETNSGLLEHAARGSVVMDTSTSDPVVSRELAQKIVNAGLEWLDAPVSGGPKGAATGQMGMLLGGESATIERVTPVLEALSARYTHVGPAGSGHVVKLANNYLCATHLIATGEAVAMAARAGVDPAACLAGLNSGSGRSAVSEVNFPEWILSERFDSGFTTGLMRKDLRLARDAAEQLETPRALLNHVVERWHEARDIEDQDDFNRIADALLATARK